MKKSEVSKKDESKLRESTKKSDKRILYYLFCGWVLWQIGKRIDLSWIGL